MSSFVHFGLEMSDLNQFEHCLRPLIELVENEEKWILNETSQVTTIKHRSTALTFLLTTPEGL